MTQTVTALYDTYDDAVSAVNALEASGIPQSDISIVSNSVHKDRFLDLELLGHRGCGLGYVGLGALSG